MQQKIARGAQHTSRLCTAHTRELVKKGFQRLIVFEKLEQKLNRHSCSTKNSDPTHFLGITFNKLLSIHCAFTPESAEAGVPLPRTPPGRPRTRCSSKFSIYDFRVTLYDGTRL